jgi:hypothetical protein
LATNNAELGDELADFARVFGWEWDVAGGEGCLGGDAEFTASEVEKRTALQGHGAEAFHFVAAFAMDNELGGEMASAVVADHPGPCRSSR